MTKVLVGWCQVARSAQVGMSARDIRDVETAFDPELLTQALALSQGQAATALSHRRQKKG